MEEESHKFVSFEHGVFAALLVLLLLYGPALCSATQTPQDNRQLRRDQAQTGRSDARRAWH